MKFFILGDSWGVGEYFLNNMVLQSVPNTGAGYWLESFGHSATNISAGSASNFGQLRHAYWTLKENNDYDYIIWFYTEPFRDIIETVINDPEEAKIQYPDFVPTDFPDCKYITHQNLKYAQMIYDEFSIPFIVVGGQCKVPNEINDFNFCYHKIQNWAAELLELDFEFPNYTWFSWQKFTEIFNHFGLSEKQFIIDQDQDLEKVKIILEKSKLSAKFPDNGHPGRQEFCGLALKILEVVGKNAR